jgi:glycerate 2-kinase
VRGNGVGGRNLETALRCAIQIASKKDMPWRHLVALSGGTDGIDGNSPAAGGFADETTVSRAGAIGLNPTQYLEASDSFRLLQILDSVLFTGPTGTNVRDLRVLLAV